MNSSVQVTQKKSTEMNFKEMENMQFKKTDSVQNWIFQANPKIYDIDSAVVSLEKIDWHIHQYLKQIRTGDCVFIWKSGKNAGIIAIGIILSEPKVMEKDGTSDPFYKVQQGNKVTPYVEIKLIDKFVENPILKEALLADERLKNISILKFANATVFPIKEEEAMVLKTIRSGEYSQVPVMQEDAEKGDEINRGVQYWIYAPGENARKWEDFYAAGLMGIGWEQLGDLRQYTSREAVTAKLQELYGKENSYKNASLCIWQFANELKPGDIVFAKQGFRKIVGRGRVVSDYIYDETQSEYKSLRKIEWTEKGEWEHPGQAVLKTLTNITQYTSYVDKLNALFASEKEEHEQEERIQEWAHYTKEDFLNDVYISPDEYEVLCSVLRRKKNLILTGAPGVGKSYIARRLAYSMMGERDESRVTFVQFHQSYSYEDFVMGYKPKEEGGFSLQDGPFYQFCKRAEEDGRDHYFIIDEINRGNVSKIFGELLMLIEADKRLTKDKRYGQQIRLAYKNELFSVPENVYIIGMMNTADRSLALIDYALRRRFAFYEMKPAFDHPMFLKNENTASNPHYRKLIDAVRELNEAIKHDESLGEGFVIGHSYFCTKTALTDVDLKAIITFEILPLLQEYWFDNRGKVDEWREKLLGAIGAN